MPHPYLSRVRQYILKIARRPDVCKRSKDIVPRVVSSLERARRELTCMPEYDWYCVLFKCEFVGSCCEFEWEGGCPPPLCKDGVRGFCVLSVCPDGDILIARKLLPP